HFYLLVRSKIIKVVAWIAWKTCAWAWWLRLGICSCRRNWRGYRRNWRCRRGGTRCCWNGRGQRLLCGSLTGSHPIQSKSSKSDHNEIVHFCSFCFFVFLFVQCLGLKCQKSI